MHMSLDVLVQGNSGQGELETKLPHCSAPKQGKMNDQATASMVSLGAGSAKLQLIPHS
jgi:hypothetical protein